MEILTHYLITTLVFIVLSPFLVRSHRELILALYKGHNAVYLTHNGNIKLHITYLFDRKVSYLIFTLLWPMSSIVLLLDVIKAHYEHGCKFKVGLSNCISNFISYLDGTTEYSNEHKKNVESVSKYMDLNS